MHPNRRSGTYLLPVLIVLSVLVCHLLLPNPGFAVGFEELSKRYFIDSSVNYAKELLLKEEYLSVLYKLTVEELKARREEGSTAALLDNAFDDLEPAYFDRDDPALSSVTMAERYKLWVEFEEREYQRRLQIILDLRDSLIENATSEQKQRMFRRELESALKYYGRQDWEIADLLFERLLRDYDFQTVDDILFYASEVCIQLKYFDGALSNLILLLDRYPNSAFRFDAYDRASELLIRLGKIGDIIRLYENYSIEGYPGDPAEMGGVHLRAAQAEIGFGHFERAVEILQRIDPASQHYLASRYYLADCFAALEKWPEAVDVLNEMVHVKQGKMPYDRWRMLVDEAKIKLAFIYYEWEEYGKAVELFNQIGNNSPFYDRVLMGRAWIAYQLDDYEAAIKKSEELLSLYPLSTEIYEAGSLAGYCYEQMGEKSTAMARFYEVLEAGVGRNTLKTFLKERHRIRDVLAQLEAMEEDVFASTDEKLYQDYKRARNILELCVKRIGLAELLEANADMRSLVQERVILDRLIQEKTELESAVISTEDKAMIAEFSALEDRIYEIMDRLKHAGMERLKSTPLYYREARIGYINSKADSLSANLEAEIDKLTASIEESEKQYQEALEADQPAKCLAIGIKMDRLDELLDQSYLNHTQSEASRRPVLQTRVDRWSDFSFNRYAMGGMEFDELDRKYERLQQVEDYIMTLDEMLDQMKEQNPPGEPTAAPANDTPEDRENETE